MWVHGKKAQRLNEKKKERQGKQNSNGEREKGKMAPAHSMQCSLKNRNRKTHFI